MCCLSLRFYFCLVPLGVVTFCQNCDILATSSALYMFTKVLLLDRLVHAIVSKCVAHLFVASLSERRLQGIYVGLFSPLFFKELYSFMPTLTALFDYCWPIVGYLFLQIVLLKRFQNFKSACRRIVRPLQAPHRPIEKVND